MKKIFLSSLSIVFSVIVIAQSSVTFYTNNGTIEITKIKCGDFDNLKVKVKIPSTINKYDKVTYKVYLSSNQATSASIRYVGEGSVATLKPNTTLEKWILSPGEKEGDFQYMDGVNISGYDLCDVPRDKGMSNIEVEVQLVGYNKNGTETYWDDWDKAYKTRIVYTKGNLLASGKISIEQLPAQTDFLSTNGILTVKKVTPDLTEVAIQGAKKRESGNAKMNQMNAFMQSVNTNDNAFEKVNVQLFGDNGRAAVDIVMYSDEKIAEEVNKIFGQIPSDLDAYAELKRDLIQKIAKNTFYGDYNNPFFKWPSVIDKIWSPTIKDLDDPKKFKPNKPEFFTNVSLWKKEKIGEYEYEVLKIPNIYSDVSKYHYNFNENKWNTQKDNNDVPGELVVYAIKRGNYNIFIFSYTNNNNNSFLVENDYEKDFLTKTIASIKYLK